MTYTFEDCPKDEQIRQIKSQIYQYESRLKLLGVKPDSHKPLIDLTPVIEYISNLFQRKPDKKQEKEKWAEEQLECLLHDSSIGNGDLIDSANEYFSEQLIYEEIKRKLIEHDYTPIQRGNKGVYKQPLRMVEDETEKPVQIPEKSKNIYEGCSPEVQKWLKEREAIRR